MEGIPLSLLTGEETAAVLDSAPVAVCIVASDAGAANGADSCKILYANRLFRELFTPKTCSGEIACYQAAGFDQPCTFCRADKLSRSEVLTRQFRHPVNHRIYQLIGKLIDWGGQTVHIEYIWDITDAQEQENRTRALSEELQKTFSSIPCGLCVYRADESGISPIFHNPAFYEIMGYSEEHIRSVEKKTDFLGVHPEDIPALQEKIREVLLHDGILRHTYRVWNDREREYHWIQLEGSVKSQEDGSKLLYGVYSDVSEEQRLGNELTEAYEKMQDIVNAIPGGVAIYRVNHTIETKYFSEGVPELTGYSVEEYRTLIKQDAAEMTYWQDRDMVMDKAREVIKSRREHTFEFRKQHRKGHVVWVRAQVKWIGEEDGCPLLHCVFHNISDLKEAQLEMEHLVNSIPGGIASYRIERGRFIPTFYSDGVRELSGHTREEFNALAAEDAFNIIYEADRKRVLSSLKTALETGEVLDVSYRIRHKNGSLLWVRLKGRRMGPLAETMKFYAVLMRISAEAKLFRSVTNDTADGIYVIDQENYDLLYVNETRKLFHPQAQRPGQKCYEALHARREPCETCMLKKFKPDGKTHEITMEEVGRYYSVSFREIDWNGIPAYVKYVQDVTESVKARREKERLEQYFQTVVKYLPGGVVVVRYEKDGRMMPEFLSDGFATMVGMTLEEAWEIYREDALAGVHPSERAFVNKRMAAFIRGGESSSEIVYRLLRGGGSYLWVKSTLSMTRSNDGEIRIYAGFHDMTKERDEQDRLRRQYNDLLMQHYRMPGPNALVVGHCNITRNKILEIIDRTDSGLLESFGSSREDFFTGIGSLIAGEEERRSFLDTYLNVPTLAAFERGESELLQECFIRMPSEKTGRYVQFKVNLVEAPDTGDMTGILTVTDITDRTISNRILYERSVAGCDLLMDVDLQKGCYKILTGNGLKEDDLQAGEGYSGYAAYLLREQVVLKDKEQVVKMLDAEYMAERLKKEGSYSFPYSIVGDKEEVLTKKLTISAIDLRLGRVCLARADITDSVREQQGLLNVMAYTFELLTIIRADSGSLTLYTRRMVLENLPAFTVENCRDSIGRLVQSYGVEDCREEIEENFRLENILERLEKSPSGYDFVLPYRSESGLRYKQINVIWGDADHKTICMVRADVTDMLAAERRTKEALERALALAEEASRAKSDFLSSMSHDIRTPMNAIMGMTALAAAHLDDRERLEDCLKKIAFSSRHLLSLINDILDMSKIERSKITLKRTPLAIPKLMEQLANMLAPQAEDAGLQFCVRMGEISRPYFYGDSLRINQILINILGNAIKFTPEGGRVEFEAEEVAPVNHAEYVRYRFTVKDTGVGMPEEFLLHIFEPFTRNSNAAHLEGTGLGLSITKGLVDLMEGAISVESRESGGTVFRVELECEPLRDGEEAETEPEAWDDTGQNVLAGRCFLVAEDNAINSEILCELLQMQGARTVLKTDGAQAVQAFMDSKPGTYDAVLMDIQMPEMNGYEATRAIRGMGRADAAEIPIVAMTANAFDEDRKAAMEAGMTAHVAKPVNVQVLMATLCRVLGGNAR